MKKELKRHIQRYRKRGWKVELSKKSHYRWRSPDGLTVVISGSTISDYRGWKNHVATLKRVERTIAP
jgi:predicted RNA binding protein YcfA (HicA-like mRNA interferase family)